MGDARDMPESIEPDATIEADGGVVARGEPDEDPGSGGNGGRSRRRVRVRRLVIGAGLGLAACVTLLVLIGVALTQERPKWWRSVLVDDPRTEEIAGAVENQVTSQVYAVRETGSGGAGGDEEAARWGFKVDPAKANAWLNTRLPRWLENERPGAWPDEVAEIQVEFVSGRIHVGVELSSQFDHRVLSATLVPRVHEDGSLWMEATRVQIGRLPIPARWVLSGGLGAVSERVPERLRELPETVHVFSAFAGEHAMMADPVVRLGDGRRVRLLGLFAHEGELRVACETLVEPQVAGEQEEQMGNRNPESETGVGRESTRVLRR